MVMAKFGHVFPLNIYLSFVLTSPSPSVDVCDSKQGWLVIGVSGCCHHLLIFIILVTFKRYAKKDYRGLHILQKPQTNPIQKMPFHP